MLHGLDCRAIWNDRHLYFIHSFDPKTPLDETLRALDDLVRQGKILYWGTSEWTGAQIAEAAQIARDWKVALAGVVERLADHFNADTRQTEPAGLRLSRSA